MWLVDSLKEAPALAVSQTPGAIQECPGNISNRDGWQGLKERR